MTTPNTSKIDRDEIEIELILHPEYEQIEGNACACGEPDCYEAHIKPIIEDAEYNPWAWCCVEVRATFDGVTGSDFLGGCSYKNEADFKTPGGYYEDMVNEAIERLEAELERGARAADRYFGRV